MSAAFTEYVDVAQIALYLFWIFFFGLVYYIRKTDRREGYPVEKEKGGFGSSGWFWLPEPKEYKLAHGHGSYFAPHDKRDDRDFALERTANWPGAAYEPTGNPMKDAVGPAAYAMRDDHPELTRTGENLIVPMRVATDYSIFAPSKDVRGWEVFGTDGEKAGTVKDIWVDRADQMVRYLEVELDGDGGDRLLPMPLALLRENPYRVTVDSITSAQFADVPTTRDPGSITALEEDKVAAYYAGGKLYNGKLRFGPLV